jgi:hypothetical protein
VCLQQAEINSLSAKLAAEARQRQELETEVRSRSSCAWSFVLASAQRVQAKQHCEMPAVAVNCYVLPLA